ncbi:hypothetical protein SCG7109_AD_00380 [Chlamydiales bacterium SCGC AG-110-M15]|nr:hypothetical protein SCG7109_AD_00380 [Chlamydiales bacterium SCGC AG-110-M15]
MINDLITSEYYKLIGFLSFNAKTQKTQKVKESALAHCAFLLLALKIYK